MLMMMKQEWGLGRGSGPCGEAVNKSCLYFLLRSLANPQKHKKYNLRSKQAEDTDLTHGSHVGLTHDSLVWGMKWLYFLFFIVLWSEPRVLCLRGKHSPTELYTRFKRLAEESLSLGNLYQEGKLGTKSPFLCILVATPGKASGASSSNWGLPRVRPTWVLPGHLATSTRKGLFSSAWFT